MAPPYQPDVPFVADGEAVAAGVTNRPTAVLARNAEYLKDRIDGAEFGEGTIARGVTLAADVLVDQPVAFHPATGRFERALAQVEEDAASHALVTSPLAQCLGIVVAKAGATRGDVLTCGRHATGLANAVAGTPTPGLYYLSASSPGMLVRQRPAVSVPAVYWDGTYAYVAPSFRGFLEEHVHHRADLVCAPAGDNAVGGGRHTIPTPDATRPGWLPAGHASFAGAAPTGAAFGYNLARHPALSALWPPVPLAAAVLSWDKGDGVGGQAIPLGLNGLCYLDRTTLWWMSDCAGDVPWPADYDADAPPAPVPPNSATPECPRLREMRLVVTFVEMLFATDKSVVTDLRPADGSPILVVNCAGQPATTGSLQLDLDLDFLTDPADTTAGSLAFKTLDGITFRRGPVVEGLFAGDNVALTADRTLTVGSGPTARTLYQGRPTIAAIVDPTGRELAPQVVRLGDAKERTHRDILFLGFPADRLSAIRLRIDVPAVGLPPSPGVQIHLLVLGSATGTLPATTMTYRRLARPGTGAAVALPADDAALACDTNLAIVADQYREVASDPITVAAGDTLFVTFARAGGDGYTGELGVIRAAGVLVSTA